MQLGVGGERSEAGVPDRVEHLDIVRTILRGDGNAVARIEAEATQRAGEPRDPGCGLAIAPQHATADAERWATGVAPACALQPQREIHGPCSVMAGHSRP